MTSATRDPRDRPPGRAPRGTAWGLGALVLMTPLAPSAAVLLSAEWLPLTLDGLLGAMFGAIVAAFPLLMVLAVGAGGRRLWGVYYFFCLGAACIGLTGVAALAGVAALSGRVRPVHTDYVAFLYVGSTAWIACLAMCWPLIRAMRLRYWQPWAPPETWEAGDERNARWTRALARPSPAQRRR